MTPGERDEISQAPAVGVGSSAAAAGVANGGAALTTPAFPRPESSPSAPRAASPSAAAAAPNPLEEQLRAALSPSFLLIRKLGQGGMASVYLAREPALRRLVAVKVLAPELAADPHSRARFEREAQAVAGLSHPNVLAIYGLGELTDGTPYFVMQYVSGKSLAARLEEEGPLDPDEAKRITGEVAAALGAAHAKGIIHRDIKPANILYDEEAGRALVSDFGIAAVRSEPAGPDAKSTKLTGTGMIVGTPQYMSPEQMLAQPVTERTDVYALGLLGYELVTGHGPFRATTPQELIAAHLRDVPPPLAEIRKDVDPEFAGLVSACLQKDQEQRPSASDVAKRLAPGGGVPLEWPPPGLDEVHGQLRRWSLWFWASTVLLVGATIALLSRSLLRASVSSMQSATQLMVLAAIAGTLMLLWAVDRLARGLKASAGSVRRGYTWLTVLETLADTRRDGGALIAGAREYAAVAPSVRSALRGGRVLRESLIFAAGLLPIFLLPLALNAGAGRTLPAGAVSWVVIVPPLLLLLGAASLAYLEGHAVADARRALRSRHRAGEEGAKLIEPWYVSFEATRQGQAMGRGGVGGARLGRIGGLVLAAAAVVIALATAPVWLLGLLGPKLLAVYWWPLGRPDPIVAESRSVGLPADSAIAPMQAGRALLQLERLASGGRGSRPGAEEQPPPSSLPAFPGGWPGVRLNAGWGDAPDYAHVLEQAAHGFTPAQMAWLRAFDAHPAWTAFHTVAVAPAVDYYGARFRLPLREDVRPYIAVRSQLWYLRRLAWYNTSRAALRLAEKRPAEAERILRETISFGQKVVDEAQWSGEEIIREGRRALFQLAGLTGRAVWGAAQNSVAPSAPQADSGANAAPIRTLDISPRASTLAAVRDVQRSRTARYQALSDLVTLPCTDVREMIFGPDQDIVRAFDAALQNLARFPSDSARISALKEMAVTGELHVREFSAPGGLPEPDPLLERAVRWSGHVSARLLGVPRIAECFDLFSSDIIFLF
ncbi:MAG: serine/threonine-protein kinase [Gemmatimonadales bacterium]